MLYSHVKTVLISSCAAVVMLCGANGGAQAQPAIIGGGSTLASTVYPEMFAVYAAIFGPGTTFTYVADGSGSGQAGFLNNQPETHGLACGTDIHFGASDATLSASPQISTWNSSGGGSTVAGCTTSNIGLAGTSANGGQGGPIIQVPSFGTTIAIPYNTPGQPNNGQLRFTDAQLCGIFSGFITSWTDGHLTNGVGDAVNYPSIVGTGAAPTGTIFVAYRGDGSGTSFLLAQHLHAVCNSTNLGAGASNLVGGNFTASTTFANNFTGATPPANFHAFTGSGGLAGGVLANSGSMGYLSPDFTLVAPVNIGANGSFPPAANVKNSNDGNFYLPTGANGARALGSASVPTNPADPTRSDACRRWRTRGFPIRLSTATPPGTSPSATQTRPSARASGGS